MVDKPSINDAYLCPKDQYKSHIQMEYYNSTQRIMDLVDPKVTISLLNELQLQLIGVDSTPKITD